MNQHAVIKLSQLSVRFGGLSALNDIGLEVAEGELLGLIGPNGAGKTTLLNVLTGVCPPSDGKIQLLGKSITGLSPQAITRLGVARTFQNIRLFSSLNVFDTVRVSLGSRLKSHLDFGTLLRGASWRADEARINRETDTLLRFFNLEHRRAATAISLPYGEQRRLEMARAIATSPSVLLLDEPAAGLNPTEKEELMALIRRIRTEFSLTILLVEHSMRVVMGLCTRIAVLDYGRLIAQGKPEEIRGNPLVIEAYLGETTHGD